MAAADLNLLVTLEALLVEGSVAGAARRLRLSPSAMSRALARLRAATGDPLLVRAGGRLVPSPRALALRERIGPLLQEAADVLRPATALDPARLTRRFTLRASEGFVETFGPALVTRLAAEAPGVRLHFQLKADRDSAPLREAVADLEAGVAGRGTGPEIRAVALFRDHFIGVVRRGHPLGDGALTPARFAAARHVGVVRRGSTHGPVDAALETLGLRRDLAVTVGDFGAALALARGTDLVASVPARQTEALRRDLHGFPLPFAVPEVTIALMWHPRLEADPAHRWLRRCVRETCA